MPTSAATPSDRRWVSLGPQGTGINALVFDPTAPQTIFAGRIRDAVHLARHGWGIRNDTQLLRRGWLAVGCRRGRRKFSADGGCPDLLPGAGHLRRAAERDPIDDHPGRDLVRVPVTFTKV